MADGQWSSKLEANNYPYLDKIVEESKYTTSIALLPSYLTLKREPELRASSLVKAPHSLTYQVCTVGVLA